MSLSSRPVPREFYSTGRELGILSPSTNMRRSPNACFYVPTAILYYARRAAPVRPVLPRLRIGMLAAQQICEATWSAIVRRQAKERHAC